MSTFCQCVFCEVFSVWNERENCKNEFEVKRGNKLPDQ